jgi:hypothetical protein
MLTSTTIAVCRQMDWIRTHACSLAIIDKDSQTMTLVQKARASVCVCGGGASRMIVLFIWRESAQSHQKAWRLMGQAAALETVLTCDV